MLAIVLLSLIHINNYISSSLPLYSTNKDTLSTVKHIKAFIGLNTNTFNA